jgi:hypothetical protein
MTIDSSGNVGIGTTPSAWSAQARAIQLGNFTAFYQNASGLPEITFNSFQNASNVDTYRISANPAAKYQLAGGHIWFTASSGTAGDPISYSERMRIDTSGNLFVGTTSSPVAGKIASSFLSSSSEFGSVFIDSQSNDTAIFAQFRNGSGALGSITNNNNTAVAYNTSSDYRLKEDVQPMVGSVDRLMALKPVNFAWKVDGSRVDGFIAHEAQEVVPEAVTGEKDGEEMQAIDHSKLVPLLTAALQGALTKIEALEARLNALEGQ